MPTRTRRIRGGGNICCAHDVSPTTLAFWVRDTQETFVEGFFRSLKVMEKASSTNVLKELAPSLPGGKGLYAMYYSSFAIRSAWAWCFT
jgi:hypothetical protein